MIQREYRGDRCLYCGVLIRGRRHPKHCVAFWKGYPYPCPKNGAFTDGEMGNEAEAEGIWLEAVFT